mgnify:CR=1 FL=1
MSIKIHVDWHKLYVKFSREGEVVTAATCGFLLVVKISKIFRVHSQNDEKSSKCNSLLDDIC